MKDLKNKKVLITGGARGIGRQIALEFARQGADIIICDSDKSFFNKNDFKKNIKEIEDIGVSCYGFYLDVTKTTPALFTKTSILPTKSNIDLLSRTTSSYFVTSR